jgi:hypothetical protein
VFAVLAGIAGTLLLGNLLIRLSDHRLYGEAFIGASVLAAGFMITWAIRTTKR